MTENISPMLTSEQQAITSILIQATQYRASDVHLLAGSPPVFRVDGKLTTVNQETIISADLLRTYVDTILTPAQRERLEKDRDVRLTVTLENKLRFRLIAQYQKGNLALDMRYIPDAIPTITELGLAPAVEAFSRSSHGFVLIVGPYGSGRTTTLAAMLQTMNLKRAAHVVTIERPIEYLYASEKSIVEQREVGVDVESVAHGIAMADREDVDVLAIGELDDHAGMRACVQAIHSGRLVLATLTADSSTQALELLVNAFPADEQPWAKKHLAETLVGILNQRLVPRIGGGRVLVSGIFTPSTGLRALIRDGEFLQLANAIQTAREEGTFSLDRSLAELVRNGDVQLADAEAVAVDASTLRTVATRE
jgi:twitching motility protein PilT